MDYLGKAVRLNSEYISQKGRVRDEDASLRRGVVIDQIDISDNRSLLIVDDEIFGIWRTSSRYIELDLAQ